MTKNDIGNAFFLAYQKKNKKNAKNAKSDFKDTAREIFPALFLKHIFIYKTKPGNSEVIASSIPFPVAVPRNSNTRRREKREKKKIMGQWQGYGLVKQMQADRVGSLPRGP